MQQVSDGNGGFLSNDPDYTRTAPASFRVVTVAENIHGSGNVLVSIEGVTVGGLTLTGSTLGGDYSFDIPDDTVLQLAPYLDGLLDVQFTFADPLDSFQIATQEDLLYDPTLPFDHYGISLAAGAADMYDAEVPEPTAFAVICCGGCTC